MTPLRWGILGTARINRMLIPPLRVSPGQPPGGRRQPRAGARARPTRSEWEIGRVHGSYEALLADPEIDVVYIPLPNHLHAEWTIKAARAGKHVLCEKPLALTVADVDAMTAAAARRGVVLAEALHVPAPPADAQGQASSCDDGRHRHAALPARRLHLQAHAPERRATPAGVGRRLPVGRRLLPGELRALPGRPGAARGLRLAGARARPGSTRPSPDRLVFPGDVLFQFDAGFRSPVRAEMELAGTKAPFACATPGARSRTTRCW